VEETVRRLAILLLTIVSLAACSTQSTPGITVPTTTAGVTTSTPDSATTTSSTVANEPAPAQLGVWTRVSHDDTIFGGDGPQWMWSVTAGGPGLVAVGSDKLIGEWTAEWTAAVWTSTDGITWTRVPNDPAIFGGGGRPRMDCVTADGPGLIAVGSDGAGGNWDAAVWTSPDGLTWTELPSDDAGLNNPNNQLMLNMTVGGPGLVAVGYDGPWDDLDAAVWTSTDGLAWTQVPHDEEVFGGEATQWIGSVVAGGPGLVAVGGDWSGGDEDAGVWTSMDGLIWNRVAHDEEVFGGEGDQWMGTVVAASPGLVAAGTDNGHAAVWTSPDGVNWTQIAHDDEVFGSGGDSWISALAAGELGLVAVGTDDGNAAVWTSLDGLTWSRVPHDELVFGGEGDQIIRAVTIGGPGLVAVGTDYRHGDQDAAVWYWEPG
jgi:hypothetical protein